MINFYRLLLLTILTCCSSSLLAREGAKPSLSFLENKGQLTDQYGQPRTDIIFLALSGNMSCYLKKDGVSYQLYEKPTSAARLFAGFKDDGDEMLAYRVDIQWLGANNNAQVVANNEQPAYNNYYTGALPVMNVNSYGSIVYKDIYAGIDLKYYQQGGSLKYDYILQPGANPYNIRLAIAGAEISPLPDGSILLHTMLGNITEGRPEVYQDGKKIEAAWVIEHNVLSFKLGKYDHTKELVIDPLVGQWSKTMSGVVTAAAYDVAMHTNGSVYWCGTNDANTDAFLDKAAGLNLFTATVPGIGSTSNISTFNACVVDQAGNVYAAGRTPNTNVATTGAFLTTVAGGSGMLIKYDDAGNKIWGTYYTDAINNCAIDAQGHVYVVGTTTKTTNISTPGCYQPTKSGSSDGFIAKFNAAGARIWGTYYGGLSSDEINGCTIDKNGRLYICGGTNSTTGIATPGSVQDVFTGQTNAYIAQLDSNGSTRYWASYYGSGTTVAAECTTDTAGNVFFCGHTNGTSNIATPGVYQTSPLANPWGSFMAKFTATGSRVWGTYGGYGRGVGCAATKNGNSYLAVDDQTANLFEFDATGQLTWLYSRPGQFGSDVHNCKADDSGNIYLSGKDKVASGAAYEVFVSKIAYVPMTVPNVSASATTFCDGASVQLTVTNGSPDFSYQWFRDSSAIPNSDTSMFTATQGGLYYVKISQNYSASYSASITLTMLPTPTTQISTSDLLCNGSDSGFISSVASGGVPPYTYHWDNRPDTTPSISQLFAGTYVLNTVGANNCTRRDSVQVTQASAIGYSAIIKNPPCSNEPKGSIQITPFGGIPLYIVNWAGIFGNLSSLNQLKAGDYPFVIIDNMGCRKNDTITLVQDPADQHSDPLVSICAVTVDSVTGGNLVIWERKGDVRADYYSIFREGDSLGVYELVGTVPRGKLSIFRDSTCNPQQQAYRYTITETDSCGTEFPKAPVHKTIHLAASAGQDGAINLGWNHYSGRTYDAYRIMRSVNGGAFKQIAQLSSSATSFIDSIVPPGPKKYRVDLDITPACYPNAVNIYSAISSNVISSGSYPAENEVVLYPNPTSGTVYIFGRIPRRILVADMAGRIVAEYGGKEEFSISLLAKGVYFVQLVDEQGRIYLTSKVVKG